VTSRPVANSTGKSDWHRAAIMVVQKQGNTRFSPGQRVVLASNGSQVTVSPR
ncbi:hypothetical protein ACUOA9_16140, partial [Escherichia sp. HC-TM1]